MLGDRIKTLRLARNLSQVELADKLHVSKQSVSNWENNNILPSVEIIKKLAIFFSCSTDYLLEMDDRIALEYQQLTPIQVAHIQQLINDFQELNLISENIKISCQKKQTAAFTAVYFFCFDYFIFIISCAEPAYDPIRRSSIMQTC